MSYCTSTSVKPRMNVFYFCKLIKGYSFLNYSDLKLIN